MYTSYKLYTTTIRTAAYAKPANPHGLTQPAYLANIPAARPEPGRKVLLPQSVFSGLLLRSHHELGGKVLVVVRLCRDSGLPTHLAAFLAAVKMMII